MWAIFKNMFNRYRGQILGWGLSLGLLGLYGVILYDSMVSPQAREQLTQLLKSYPPELMAFFGGVADIFSPAGYLNLEFFSYMPIIIGIFAILVGSGLLVGDEEKGILDLVLSYPISRTQLFFGRLVAFIVVTMAILLIIWLGFALPLPRTTMNIQASEMLSPFLSLLVVLIFFGAFSLLLSMLLPSQRLSAMTAGLVLVASYFIKSLANIDSRLADIEKFTPLHFYQGGLALNNLNWGDLGVLAGFSALFILIAWWRFERRDIRVGGEGGWGLSRLSLRKNNI